MSKGKNIYILYICVGIALLPILLLRDFTPNNELRYLSIADEALRNHSFFAFTNHGVPYADKPPLYFWLVMLGKWLLGSHRMWFLSLFSVVPAVVTTHVMYRWTEALLEPRWRLAGAMMMLTCGLFTGMAITLRMDMLMCMFIVLSLHAFYMMSTGGDAMRKYRWRFPLYVFLAVFSKGPVGILVPLLSSAVYLLWQGRLRSFGRYWGRLTWGVLLALCAAWFAAVYAEGGDGYLDNLLFHQTVGRAVNSFHHKEPFYYYLVSVWYSLAPWSLLVVGAMAAALSRRPAATGLQRMFLSAALSTFVMLSLVSSKIQIYLLPAFPFMVYSALLSLQRLDGSRLARAALAVPAAAFALCWPAFAVAVGREGLAYLDAAPLHVAALALSASGVCVLVALCRRGGSMPLAVRSMAAGMLCALFAGGFSMPRINREIGLGAVCAEASAIARQKGIADIAAWDVPRAENADVYLGRPVRVLAGDSVPQGGSPGRVLLITRTRNLARLGAERAVPMGKYSVAILKGRAPGGPGGR